MRCDFRELTPASFVVASSDVMLDLNPSNCDPLDVPQNAVSVVAVPESPEVAKNHGVLVTSEAESTSVAPHIARASLYLQKPDVNTMRKWEL